MNFKKERMMYMKENIYRTHHCCDIDKNMVGEKVVVSGWIENIRDHGGVLFLDLRDNTETLQTVSNDDSLFVGLAKESVVRLTGTIRKRDEETYNDRIKTGPLKYSVIYFSCSLAISSPYSGSNSHFTSASFNILIASS